MAISLKDADVIRCPQQAHDYLLNEAPIYFDPVARFYVVSRYEDCRTLLSDNTALTSEHVGERLRGDPDPARAARIRQLFADEGWPRERAIGHYDGQDYRERRRLFESFLRAGRIREKEDEIRDIAYALAEAIADQGEAEMVSQFCEQMSLRIIFRLLGAPTDALPVIKDALDAMVANLGFVGTEEEEIAGARKEIAAQHYFMALIESKRAHPDDTILSAFVNADLPSGARMTDAQILMHVMLDLFMAGGETTSKALSSGIYLLCQDRALQDRLASDPDNLLRGFAEEVLRLEGPAVGLYRLAKRDISLHGATIPQGALVALRVAAANRDDGHFACPASVNLERDNAATHLSFGSGAHACLGSYLARRELYWGFRALLDTVRDIRVQPGSSVTYAHNWMFRAIEHLPVSYSRR
ncbi:cytochrome P450 [Sphingobium sp. 15-1]|uniref:cytochrome P450 n=1 Tax=Sphingobium sp. 15-1 TaxID=2729616 RepID=UPI00159CBBF5|nr:cytochrome P450 [Sphingobium sp. 15-1]